MCGGGSDAPPSPAATLSKQKASQESSLGCRKYLVPVALSACIFSPAHVSVSITSQPYPLWRASWKATCDTLCSVSRSSCICATKNARPQCQEPTLQYLKRSFCCSLAVANLSPRHVHATRRPRPSIRICTPEPQPYWPRYIHSPCSHKHDRSSLRMQGRAF